MTEKRALPKIPFFYWNLTRKITTRVPNQSRASTKYRKHLWPHQCRQTSLEVAELLLKKLPRPLPNKGNGPRYWRWVANHGVWSQQRIYLSDQRHPTVVVPPKHFLLPIFIKYLEPVPQLARLVVILQYLNARVSFSAHWAKSGSSKAPNTQLTDNVL